MDNLVRLSHLHSFVVLYHYFVKAVAKGSDLAHHWMVIIIHLARDIRRFICAFLQVVELLTFDRCFRLQVVKFTPLNRKVFLDIPLSLAAVFSFLCGNRLLFDLALEKFVLLFERIQDVLVLRLLCLSSLHLRRSDPEDLFVALM